MVFFDLIAAIYFYSHVYERPDTRTFRHDSHDAAMTGAERVSGYPFHHGQ